MRLLAHAYGMNVAMFPMRRLDVYLNDHLAGAMVGAELSRRAAENNRGTTLGDFLEELHQEIVEDRQTLQRVMTELGVDRSPLKPAAGWVLEKAGRLKLNGQIRGYSPLSRLVELEGLETGVSGKRALWQTLSSVFHGDPRLAQFNLDGLIARAEEQLEGIGEQRIAVAPDALTERAATASR
jgi:hypothetical protein